MELWQYDVTISLSDIFVTYDWSDLDLVEFSLQHLVDVGAVDIEALGEEQSGQTWNLSRVIDKADLVLMCDIRCAAEKPEIVAELTTNDLSVVDEAFIHEHVIELVGECLDGPGSREMALGYNDYYRLTGSYPSLGDDELSEGWFSDWRTYVIRTRIGDYHVSGPELL